MHLKQEIFHTSLLMESSKENIPHMPTQGNVKVLVMDHKGHGDYTSLLSLKQVCSTPIILFRLGT